MYEVGQTGEDKIKADNVFKYNMLAHIKANSNWFMRLLRNRMAKRYHFAVAIGGGIAFYDDKPVDHREG
jgi:hypothetical protein